jgi:hypothetical protein
MISVLPARGALEFLRAPNKVIERQGAKAAKETTPSAETACIPPVPGGLILAALAPWRSS